MSLTQAQTADEDEPSQSFYKPMRESFNDNTSDYMYKHIEANLLSFFLSSTRWHRMHISFHPKIFLWSEIHVKLISQIQFSPSS